MAPLLPHQSADGPVLTVPGLLRELADALETDPTDCPDAAKRERLVSLLEGSGRLDAVIAREVSVFDANTVWAGDGARSAGGWIQARTEISRSRAIAIVGTARDLRSCPHVEAAWTCGRVGTAKVQLLLGARQVHPRLFADAEADLVALVAPLTVARAAVRIAQWSD